jgi:hypothetical protein
MPLPASPHEMAIWTTVTIQPDYLIPVGNCKYSVPHEFIDKKVDIRTTDNSIKVFYHNNRIVSHMRRTYSPEPVYLPEHIPENHRKLFRLGENVGCSSFTVVNISYICTKLSSCFCQCSKQRKCQIWNSPGCLLFRRR